jgi:putative transposase
LIWLGPARNFERLRHTDTFPGCTSATKRTLDMAKEQDERESENGSLQQRLLTLTEVADYLHVHPSTIYRLLYKNDLLGFKIGRDWRFNLEQIDQIRFGSATLNAHGEAESSINPVVTALSRRGGSTATAHCGFEAGAGCESKADTKRGDPIQRTDPADSLTKEQTEYKKVDLHRGHKRNGPTSNDAPNRFGGRPVPQPDRVHQLEEENGRLRRIVADQALDIQALKDSLTKRA